ncbi:MAG: DUF177 domain-containing protein [Chloroflexi bacterium]|nr:DUF177 domain-containing protein [Chloroflexota bacterium]
MFAVLAKPTIMVINVAQLLKEPVGSTRTVDVSGDEELDVQGHVELVRTDRSILVRGRLSTDVETTCSRCACPITCGVTFDVEEEFFPTIDVVSGMPLAVPEDDAFTIDEHHILDLHEAVRQYALLSLPIKRLCRFDCRGLCSACGRNLNEGACSCQSASGDPRWAGLEQLFSAAEVGRPGVNSTNAAQRKLKRR